LIDGRVLLRADTKRKGRGTFKGLAYWRVPPRNKEYWKRLVGLVEPEWMIAKSEESISLKRPGGTREYLEGMWNKVYGQMVESL
jgi:hypothetical protein